MLKNKQDRIAIRYGSVPPIVIIEDKFTEKFSHTQVKHLKNCTFYTDSWDAFSKVLPKGRHVIGKQHTVGIERDNSNIRNDLARFTRRTKVVSRSEHMVNNTLKLWHAFHTSSLFFDLQAVFLSVFK